MRLSDLFTRTLRDAPAEAEMVNHQLALRAGLVRPIASGIYATMPLGLRVIHKIATILREEMEAIGAQEIRMPVVHPAEIWQASGRWESYGPTLQKFTTDNGREFALGPTHEDVTAWLVLREIKSYKQLPQIVYQIQTKYRQEPRPRGGLVRLREFTMKDAYSMHADVEGLDSFYEQINRAYLNIFARAGVEVIQVEADTGAMGGRVSHEFAMRHELGEDRFACCDSCGYAANVETAKFTLAEPEAVEWEAVSKVPTPDTKTIADLAVLLNVPTAQTLKAVFFVNERAGSDPQFVFAVVRGDLEVNEVKLINALGGGMLRPATDDEIRAVGAVPGYASPLGIDSNVIVIADRSVKVGANFVAGANEEGYHLMGINVPRDFNPAHIADIAEAFDGAICGRCGAGTLHLVRAIELGHIFKLGTRYSDPMGVQFLGEDGLEHPVIMGSYGIGLERLMAAVIEQHHDDAGIIWPESLTPFHVHIVMLGTEYADSAAKLHDDLCRAGLDVLLDDRTESAGVKFADADLIGIPVRLTISKKALANGGVEAKRRDSADRIVIPLDDVIGWVREQYAI